ncbi:hypothetical protein GCM10025759_16100 [Lysobacter panacisoli]|uniref:Uncharacterized protein n=1 Tax=Lysobacter panacisoli TaxID=1255263 RepID=A0ABP9LDR1_9GAMM
METQALGMLREVEHVRERLRRVAAFGDGRKIEDGKRNHAGTLLGIDPPIWGRIGSMPAVQRSIRIAAALHAWA